jgi:hypothetical protein
LVDNPGSDAKERKKEEKKKKSWNNPPPPPPSPPPPPLVAPLTVAAGCLPLGALAHVDGLGGVLGLGLGLGLLRGGAAGGLGGLGGLGLGGGGGLLGLLGLADHLVAGESPLLGLLGPLGLDLLEGGADDGAGELLGPPGALLDHVLGGALLVGAAVQGAPPKVAGLLALQVVGGVLVVKKVNGLAVLVDVPGTVT